MSMNKSKINDLIQKFDISNIEKHLIYIYLDNRKLDFEQSPILSKKFENFQTSANLFLLCSTLELNDLKTLENYLELLIPKNDRKVNGAFFTPNYIVDFIINETNPNESEKCLDPSCGCGAFLIGLVEYFKKNFNKSVKQIIKQNIYGADILEYNIDRTKTLLSILGLQYGEIIEESDLNIENKDSLKDNWQNKFDVIVGNPPYVKYQDLDDKNRVELLKYWKSIESGTFNLYFAFFELGYKLLNNTGRLGYITPNNYFTSLSGISLRQYFHQNKCLTRIIDFSHKKVFDAQTYTAISFLNKQKNDAVLYDKILDSQECPEFLIKANGSPNYLDNLNVKKWRLLKKQEQENIRIIETIGTPIKDLFNIAVGIATLKDEVFFVNSINEKNGLIKKITENGTFYIEKEITKPVYKISNFKSQDEIKSNALRIITPYYTNLKTAIPIQEDEFKEKYPKCYEYLLSEKVKLESRDKGKSIFIPFYSWGRTQGITRFGKKILNPTFSKHPRFLFVPEEDAYYTNGYGIYFSKSNNGEATLFDDFTHPLSKEENILIAQKVLNSIIMDYYITKTSVAIQGGFPCYQKNFIEKFTIPNFSDYEISILHTLNVKDEIDNFLIEKYRVNIQIPNLVE
jgi:adenine-specific DNA-methyltransferase